MTQSLWNASTPIARRTFLHAGGLSAIGLTLPQILAGRASAAPKSGAAAPVRPPRPQPDTRCDLLADPRQKETFDLKPDAPGSAKSLFKPIATNVPGIQI